MTTPHFKKSIGRWSSRLALLLIPLVFACFALCPMAQAVSPAPDGAYPGGNTAEGGNALFSLTTGQFNTAVGLFSLTLNTGGNSNTGVGASALRNNTTGNENTAVGASSLLNNKTGDSNTANGARALLNNTTGGGNTAVGLEALQSNTIGDSNTANGSDALWKNTTGFDNAANGARALLNNTTGSLNTATGSDALSSNTTGFDNTANGYGALASNTTGFGNTANGELALESNTTGNFNIASGYFAGFNLTTGSNNIDIGNLGVAGEANTIRIGNVVATVYSDGLTHPAQTRTFIAGIRGRTTGFANAVPVVIDSAGQLGTTSSSRRFKNEIKPMEKASEAILALKPVTFHYKSDKTDTPQFGLIAEEVAQVNPNLVIYDADGKPYTVRYDAVNAMLLNEFLKEYRTVQEQKAIVAQLKKDFRATVAQLTTRLDEQAAQIQKVSAQLEASKPAPQVVNNP